MNLPSIKFYELYTSFEVFLFKIKFKMAMLFIILTQLITLSLSQNTTYLRSCHSTSRIQWLLKLNATRRQCKCVNSTSTRTNNQFKRADRDSRYFVVFICCLERSKVGLGSHAVRSNYGNQYSGFVTLVA